MNRDLGDRMKQYEDVSRFSLTRRLPLIIRLDGKAFHTYTKKLPKPYCISLMAAMNEVTKTLCHAVQNTVMAYTQSDEISLLVIDYRSLVAEAWFGANLQKMVSVAAGIASAKMTALSPSVHGELREATFDARAFVLPEGEVHNYFVWRQEDWQRNSLNMLAQSLFSHKTLQGKSNAERLAMCKAYGHDWEALDSHLKYGRVIKKTAESRPVGARVDKAGNQVGPVNVIRGVWAPMPETPVFARNRNFVEDFVSSASTYRSLPERLPEPKKSDRDRT